MLSASLLWAPNSMAYTEPLTLASGMAVEQLPSGLSAKTQRSKPIPYVGLEWPDHVNLSR